MKHLIRSSFGTLVLSVVALTSCITQDLYISNTMTPPSQDMYTAIDSSLQVRTYTISVDSIGTSNVNDYVLVGDYLDATSGHITATGFSNYMPQGFWEDTYFGTNAVIDSMKLMVNLSYQVGDTSKGASTLRVYEVVGYNFKCDSSYYSNFDMSPYIDSEPLWTGEIPASGGELTDLLPMEFAERFLDDRWYDDENIYNHDTLFHEVFNGFYFELEPPAGSEGAIYALTTQDSYSRMFIYYSNDDYPDSVLVQRLYFESPDDDYGGYNTNFTMYERDYTQADVSNGGIDYRTINDTLNQQSVNYIFAPAGISARVELDTSTVDSLVAKAKEMGYESIAIHKAQLSWKKVDQSSIAMNEDLNDLVLYYDFTDPTYIPDYNYLWNYYDSSTYPITIDGELDRMSGYYVQDITRYLQSYLAGLSSGSVLELAPLIDDRHSYAQTEVYGSQAEDPADRPKMVVIYTFTK
ncbi:MAG: DUF4270 family protein [Rikenellaceae bacterium]